MLGYQEFQDFIRENIKGEMTKEYENATVEIRSFTKNNGIVLDGLTIYQEGTSISPTIYLNELYGQYQQGRNLYDILSQTAEVYMNAGKRTMEAMHLDIENDIFTDRAKEWITFRVCGYEANKEMLQTMPHEKIGDMAMTYHVIASQREDGIGSIRITDSLMEEIGITEAELKSLAIENTRKMYPPTLKSMSEIVEEMLLGRRQEGGEIGRPLPEDGMYVLSNSMGINGAAALFYPDVQEQIADTLGKNYYVLPSSIHEVIIVPDDGKVSQQELSDMVRDVNQTQVPLDEVLTNNVYHFNKETKELSAFIKSDEKSQDRKASIKETLKKAKEQQREVMPRPKQEKVKSDLER